MAMHDAAGRTHEGAGVSGKMAEALWLSGQVDRAVERMEASFAVLSGDEPDQDLAMFVAQLARFHYFSGNLELARERVDFALRIAEDRVLPEVLSQALNTKNLVLLSESRYEEGLALLKHALDVAVEGDLTAAAGRALPRCRARTRGRRKAAGTGGLVIPGDTGCRRPRPGAR